MSRIIATRGPKVGQCNICGEYAKLTEDHTPPKGCLKPRQVELHNILRLLTTETRQVKVRSSQNGVKYRTLCSRCNNTLLGTQYDPSFISFVNSVGNLLRSALELPQVVYIPAQPQAIMRSLLGHISAQGVGRYKKGPLTDAFRGYFLDPTLPLPDGIRIFYWAYPYGPHVMARDVAYLDIPSHTAFSIWILKFFPIAFMVTWDEPKGLNTAIHGLDSWRSCHFDQTVDLHVFLKTIPPVFWPEAPTDQSVLVYGKETIFIKQK